MRRCINRDIETKRTYTRIKLMYKVTGAEKLYSVDPFKLRLRHLSCLVWKLTSFVAAPDCLHSAAQIDLLMEPVLVGLQQPELSISGESVSTLECLYHPA